MFTQVFRARRALWYPVEGSDKVALFLPGFPKYPGNSTFVELLQSCGYGVLVPMYAGTFESAGTFSVASSVADVSLWNTFLEKEVFQYGPRDHRSQKIRTIILIGSSYGGLIGGLSLRAFALPRIKTAIFLTPLWGMARHLGGPTQNAVADDVARVMTYAYPHSYRFADKAAFFRMMKGKLALPLMDRAILDPKKRVIVCAGRDDTTTPKEMGEALALSSPRGEFHLFDGGHSSRIAWEPFSRIIRETL